MAETSTRQDRAALRRVVDQALRGMRAKARMPHPVRPQGEARWVMSSDGVIDAPTTHTEPHLSEPSEPSEA